jgi:lipopolysaccharide transport system ATP-binding protein
MRDTVIKIENLSKKYIIAHQAGTKGQHTLRDVITDRAKSLTTVFAKKPDDVVDPTHEEFWALNDISFEIKQGDRVGIIGRNGAGKSTLLKILSRITEPSRGKVTIDGRVASLLEVGTGFHAELTGRENIFLNGAILGMSKIEIKRKFDEIVAFSEVEKFLDTPVKRYSSGMYVRLAFSVAAHLEPEILIVDEVLAVGDMQFQKKCLGKMEDVGKEGRTILFVSHNMALVQALCDRGIFLTQGSVSHNDTMSNTVNAYLTSLEQVKDDDLVNRRDRNGIGNVRISRVKLHRAKDDSAITDSLLQVGDPVKVKIDFVGHCPGLECRFTIYEQQGLAISTFTSADCNPSCHINGFFICKLDELLLTPGRYRINVALSSGGHLQDHLEGAAFFDVEQGTVRGRPVLPNPYGFVYFPHSWLTE